MDGGKSGDYIIAQHVADIVLTTHQNDNPETLNCDECEAILTQGDIAHIVACYQGGLVHFVFCKQCVKDLEIDINDKW